MRLFVYVYHGIMAVLNSFVGFCRYFYLGLKWFPSILLGMVNDVTGSKKNKIKTNNPIEEKQEVWKGNVQKKKKKPKWK